MNRWLGGGFVAAALSGVALYLVLGAGPVIPGPSSSGGGANWDGGTGWAHLPQVPGIKPEVELLFIDLPDAGGTANIGTFGNQWGVWGLNSGSSGVSLNPAAIYGHMASSPVPYLSAEILPVGNSGWMSLSDGGPYVGPDVTLSTWWLPVSGEGLYVMATTGAEMYINGSSHLVYFFYTTPSLYTECDVSPVSYYNSTEWDFWAATYASATGAGRIYRDGDLVGSCQGPTDGGTLSAFWGNGQQGIGGLYVGGWNSQNGDLIDPRIYNVALSQYQIQQLYQGYLGSNISIADGGTLR